MRSAKVFLAGMYFHIVLSIGVPVFIFMTGSHGWTGLSVGVFLGYLLMAGIVHLAGWISAGMAVCAYRSGAFGKLIKGWKLLKLWSIPFYIVNFIYSFLVWFILIGASRGLLILLVPIPVYMTCSMVVQSGVYGICVVRYLRRLPGNGGQPDHSRYRPSRIHYILQPVSALDIISTVVIIHNYRSNLNDSLRDPFDSDLNMEQSRKANLQIKNGQVAVKTMEEPESVEDK